MLFTNSVMTTGGFETVGAHVAQQLRDHKGKYIFQGTAFIVAGMMAGLFPAATALNAELIIGAILLFIGILQLYLTIKSEIHGWSMLSAGLSIVAGLVMLWQPLAMLLAFITLLALFMTLEGVLELLLAFQFRPVRSWGWMFFSGVVTLVLAMVLWVGYPVFDVLYLGWIIAINLVLYGVSLLMMVWHASA